MSELQRDIDTVKRALLAANPLPSEADFAFERIRQRLSPDREAEEREAADIEVIRFARRAAGLLHDFMLDTNAIGARAAGVNLARSIKEALKADAAALAAKEGE